MMIYDSRNYWGLTDKGGENGNDRIYDSRNYWGLTDVVGATQTRWSTIVEITEVLQTCRLEVGDLVSTIVEITEVLQTGAAVKEKDDLR